MIKCINRVAHCQLFKFQIYRKIDKITGIKIYAIEKYVSGSLRRRSEFRFVSLTRCL